MLPELFGPSTIEALPEVRRIPASIPKLQSTHSNEPAPSLTQVNSTPLIVTPAPTNKAASSSGVGVSSISI
ncbi:MAG: hypothetical protein IPG60_09595 [Bacteroidetes bacterium]|nr:hypothetical protein [Bacteroidota bacterium]